MEDSGVDVVGTSKRKGKALRSKRLKSKSEEAAFAKSNTEYVPQVFQCPDGLRAVPLRLSAKDSKHHSIYIVEDASEHLENNFPNQHQLKLLNVPPYVTASSFILFFEQFGRVKSVEFDPCGGDKHLDALNRKNMTEFTNHEEPFQFKTAYVVFGTARGLLKASKVTSIDLFHVMSDETTINTGLSLWYDIHLAKFLDGETTMMWVRKYLERYEQDCAEKERLLKEREAADEDGWRTVGANGGFARNADHINKLHKRMKAKPAERSDFYRHQIREINKKELEELRKKYAEDVKRIQASKARKFRP